MQVSDYYKERERETEREIERQRERRRETERPQVTLLPKQKEKLRKKGAYGGER